jgi:hypothetical protein
LVLGGLPSTQAQNDMALAAYDAWLLTDDGVPPEETSWSSRRAFSLNITRYVQTGTDAETVDVTAEVTKLQELISKRNEAEAVMFEHLKRLGYV